MPRRPKLAEAVELDASEATLRDVTRFLAKVRREGDCWIWTGHLDDNGYGQFRFGGKIVGAHRFSYAVFRGMIPRRRHVHHGEECTNHACVAPGHLAPLTHAKNSLDGSRRAAAQRDAVRVAAAVNGDAPTGHGVLPF